MLYSEEPCAMAIMLIPSLPSVLKTLPGDARGSDHVFADGRDDGHVAVYLDVLEVVLVDVFVQGVPQGLLCARGVGGLHDKADAVL